MKDNLGHVPRHDESAAGDPVVTGPGSSHVSVATAVRHAPFALQHNQIPKASPVRSGDPDGFAVLAQRI
jgi:hypothetical protein